MSWETPSLGQSRETDHWRASFNSLKFLLVWGFIWTFLPLEHSLCWTNHSPIPTISWPSFPCLLGHIVRSHEAQMQVGSSRDIPSFTVPSCSAMGKPESLLQLEPVKCLRVCQTPTATYWPGWPAAWPQDAEQDSMVLQFEDHRREMLLLLLLGPGQQLY